MWDGFNIYAKEKINEEGLMKKLDLTKEDIYFVYESNDWLSKKEEGIVIEYNGILDKEDTDKYEGFHYYDVSLYKKIDKERFKILSNEQFILDFEQEPLAK